MPKRKINIEELRELGFAEDVIAEAVQGDKQELFDIESSISLADKTFAVCRTETLKIGDIVDIKVTGMAETFEATVIGFDSCKPTPHPRLKVDHPGWKNFTLKDGDYILIPKKREQ